MAEDKKKVTHLLKQAVIELCTARLSKGTGLEIDGILCVTIGDDDEENHVIIKVHKKISSEPDTEKDVEKDEDLSAEINFMPQMSPESDCNDVPNSANKIKQENGQCHTHSMRLRRHSPRHAKETSLAGKDIDTENIKNEQCNDEQKPAANSLNKKRLDYICETCEKTFSQKSALVRHSRTHTGERPFECSECNTKYGDVTTLRRHMASIHDMPPGKNIKPHSFPCEICGKVLRTKYSLKHHIRAVHQGIKTYPKHCLCTLCGKICRNVTVLKEHQNKWHLNIKPYECKTCGRSFHAKGLLRAHEKQTHSDIRNYACEECGKAFKRHNALKEHLLTHTTIRPNECDICRKRFLQKAGLVRHYRTHTGLRPFRCRNCHACFADASTLRRHIIAVHNVPREKWNKDDFEMVAEKCDRITVLPRGRRRQQHKVEQSDTASQQDQSTGPVEAIAPPMDHAESTAVHQNDASNSSAVTNPPDTHVLVLSHTESTVMADEDNTTTEVTNNAAVGGCFLDGASKHSTDEQTDENVIAFVETKGNSLITWGNEMMSLSEDIYIILNDSVVQPAEELVTTEDA